MKPSEVPTSFVDLLRPVGILTNFPALHSSLYLGPCAYRATHFPIMGLFSNLAAARFITHLWWDSLPSSILIRSVLHLLAPFLGVGHSRHYAPRRLRWPLRMGIQRRLRFQTRHSPRLWHRFVALGRLCTGSETASLCMGSSFLRGFADQALDSTHLEGKLFLNSTFASRCRAVPSEGFIIASFCWFGSLVLGSWTTGIRFVGGIFVVSWKFERAPGAISTEGGRRWQWRSFVRGPP